MQRLTPERNGDEFLFIHVGNVNEVSLLLQTRVITIEYVNGDGLTARDHATKSLCRRDVQLPVEYNQMVESTHSPHCIKDELE